MLKLQKTENTSELTKLSDMATGDVGYIKKWPSGGSQYINLLVMKVSSNTLVCLDKPNYYWTSLNRDTEGYIEVLPNGTKLTFIVE